MITVGALVGRLAPIWLVFWPCIMWRLLAAGGRSQVLVWLDVVLAVLELVLACWCAGLWPGEVVPGVDVVCWWAGPVPDMGGYEAQGVLELV